MWNESNRRMPFTLFPMSEDFVDVILSALEQVDTSKVWKETDDVSTCIRGKMDPCFWRSERDLFHAVKSGKHVAMSGTFSIGCPGDSEGHVYMDETNEPMNQQNVQEIQQKAGCKFALYPMGTEDYMEKITEQIDLSKEWGVKVTPTHYATRLDGEVKDIFSAMKESFAKVQTVVNHITMTFTISANSPSNQ